MPLVSLWERPQTRLGIPVGQDAGKARSVSYRKRFSFIAGNVTRPAPQVMLRSVKERPHQLTRGTAGSYDGCRVLRSEHEFAPNTALR